MEAHFSDKKDRKSLSLYETMYVERALRSKGKYNKLRLLQQEIRQIHKKYLCHLFICQPIHIPQASKLFFYIKSFRIRETEWLSVRTIGLFKTQWNIYDRALLQK